MGIDATNGLKRFWAYGTILGPGCVMFGSAVLAQDSDQAMAETLHWVILVSAGLLGLIAALIVRSLLRSPSNYATGVKPGAAAPVSASEDVGDLVENVDRETRSAVGQMAHFVGQQPLTDSDAPLVDKRKAPRYQLNRGGAVMTDGHVYPVVIENISVGGIKGRGLPQGIAPGAQITIAIEGATTTLTTLALKIKEGVLHGQFILSPDANSNWERDFFTLVRELTPVPDF